MSGPVEIPLDALQHHHCGVVLRVDAQDDDMKRLMAMGVCRGRTVELIRRGDPLILKVLGTRIGVSSRLARRVFVEPCTYKDCMATHDLTPREGG